MGKHLILVLAADVKRFSFMSLYERDFVLRWVMSIDAAEAQARHDRFDFALVSFDPDPQRAIEFCERLKATQRQVRVIFLKRKHDQCPEDFCADLILDSEISEQELAARLQTYIKRPA